jgi:hypothetical protein
MIQFLNSKRQVFEPSLEATEVPRPEQSVSIAKDRIKRPEIFLKLDSPLPDQPVARDQAVQVTGWLAASEPLADVIVEIGEARQKATIGVSRPDLAEAYPDVPALAHAGFIAALHIPPLAQIDEQPVKLKVTATTIGGAERSLSVPLVVAMAETRERQQSRAKVGRSVLDSSAKLGQLISSDLVSDEPPPMRGCIDFYDLEQGLAGWAVDLTHSDRPLELELTIGRTVVARRETTHYRDDISELLQKRVCAGFNFEPSCFAGLKNYFDVHGDAEIKIRVAGTNYYLPATGKAPTLSAVYTTGAPDQLATPGFNLVTRLSRLLIDARDLLAAPLRPADHQLAGFIEVMAIGERVVWFSGWMKETPLLDHAAIIVDRQKAPAALTILPYPRSDLEAGAHGVIGALLTDWRPSSFSEPILYFGPDGSQHLKGVLPIQIKTFATFSQYFAEFYKGQERDRIRDLSQLFESSVSIGNVEGFAQSIRAAVDRVLVLPGFGAVVSGWVLSPVLKVRSFAMHFGRMTLECDGRSLYFTARPDLLDAFPGDSESIARAGFCYVCCGALETRDLKEAILSVLLEDGSQRSFPINSAVIHRLAHSASLNRLLELYPSIEHEPFFAALTHSICADLRASSTRLTPRRVLRSAEALIVVIPEERQDYYLLFDDLRRNAASSLGPSCGIVLIAETGQSHGELLSLFETLSDQLPTSLVFVEGADFAVHALPEILMLTHTERFCFIARGCFLTANGWAALRRGFDSPRLSFLEVIDPANSDVGGHCSSAAFMWSPELFQAWLETAPVLIGEHLGIHLFPEDQEHHHLVEGAVQYSRVLTPSRLFAAINQKSLALR